jgi:ceramide glucosyltransferase
VLPPELAVMALAHPWLSACGTALAAVVMGYMIAAAIALRVRRAPPAAALASAPPTTILKPLCGAEPGLYEHLRSFCEQSCDDLQIIFGVRDHDDPALGAVRRLQQEFPHLDLQIAANPAQHGSSRKVSNLVNMMALVRHDYLVIADGDVRVGRGYLERVIAPLLDQRVGIVTCLYHGSPRPGLWSLLGSMFINEWFMPAVRVAALFGSRSFAFGATIAVRRETLSRIGGFTSIADQLPDDYRLGELTRRKGLRTVLSEVEVQTCVEETGPAALAAHDPYRTPARLRAGLCHDRAARGGARLPLGGWQRRDPGDGGDHRGRPADDKFGSAQAPLSPGAAMAGGVQRPAGVCALVLELHGAPRALATSPLPGGARWDRSGNSVRHNRQ